MPVPGLPQVKLSLANGLLLCLQHELTNHLDYSVRLAQTSIAPNQRCSVCKKINNQY
jgi:hypothetical protein